MEPRTWLSRTSVAVAVAAAGLGLGACMNCPKPEAPAPKPIAPTGPVAIDLAPASDTNPVKTQHVFVATVRDAAGNAVPGVEVEWILTRAGNNSVGDIVDVDGGRKVDNTYAKSVTGSTSYTIDRGNGDASDDVRVGPGQTWCVITSMEEGQSKVVAYAPAIRNWDNHKAFAVKNWADLSWEAPVDATNRVGTPHTFNFRVFKYSDGSPIPGCIVTWTIVSGPDATLTGGGKSATTKTDDKGVASVTLEQTAKAVGTNDVQIQLTRPAMKDECRCWPEITMGPWVVRKNWISPSIAITKAAPARESVGHQFAYDIVVSNTSNELDVRDVVVTDPLPDGIAYDSSNPAAEVSGNNLTWRLGTLPPGGSRALQVMVHGTRTGTFENCATVNAEGGALTARACATTVIVMADVKIEKRGPQAVTVCDAIPYTITITNTGTGEATGVRVADALPAGLTTGDPLEWNVGTLGAGESRSFNLTAKAGKPGTYTNTATVTGDGGIRGESSVTTQVTQCVLTISKKARAEQFLQRPIEYSITVTNTGDADANNVVVQDAVPMGTSFQSASDGGMLQGGTIVWNLGTIAKGGSRTISASVLATSAGTVRNVATARGDCCEEVSAAAETKVVGVPAILLELVDRMDPIEVGGTENYDIDVTNQGTAPDVNVVVKCMLPAEEDFVSASGPDGVQAQVAGKTVTFAPYPSLAAGAKVRYTVVVKANQVGDVRFRVELTSDMLRESVIETESTHIY